MKHEQQIERRLSPSQIASAERAVEASLTAFARLNASAAATATNQLGAMLGRDRVCVPSSAAAAQQPTPAPVASGNDLIFISPAYAAGAVDACPLFQTWKDGF